MLVFYHFETGGLKPGWSDILQISAVSSTGEEYDTYVRPKNPISPRVSARNNLWTDSNLNLYRGARMVPTISMTKAMRLFIAYLQGLWQDAEGDLCLVAHSGKSFDHRFLRSAVRRPFLRNAMRCLICGLADSLPIIRTSLKRTKGTGLEDLALEHLRLKLSHKDDALSKVRALKRVVEKLKIPKNFFCDLSEQYF